MQINYDRITLYDIWIKEREDENERLKNDFFLRSVSDIFCSRVAWSNSNKWKWNTYKQNEFVCQNFSLKQTQSSYKHKKIVLLVYILQHIITDFVLTGFIWNCFYLFKLENSNVGEKVGVIVHQSLQ